ncbi:MAG TPA: hypothetical protein VJ960_01945 [Oceanipulchritudo sp.]|nr:hypothetical protein [Oceanipulchritudo sp.]
MKGLKLLPLLATMLTIPLYAQESGDTPAPVAALEQARTTIEDTDANYRETESEVLEAGEGDSNPPAEEGEGESEPVFEFPQGEVSLDLPGETAEGTMITSDSETISVDFPEEDVRDIIRSVAD